MCPPNRNLNVHQVSAVTFSYKACLTHFSPSLLPSRPAVTLPGDLGCTPQTQLIAATGGPQSLQLFGPFFMSCPGISWLTGGSGMRGWEWILLFLNC